MYNKHLDTFLKVTETGSFSKAAEACHISRTALIQQINILEDHVGVQLLNRSSRGVELTPAGQVFAERAKEMIHLSEETIARCRSIQDLKRVRIGILPNLPLTILGPVCIEYGRLYPDIRIEFVEREPSKFVAAFCNNEFDISADYMSRLILPNEDTYFVKLATDKFNCAVPPNSSLAQKESIEPEDMEGWKVGILMDSVALPETRLRKYLKKHVPKIEVVDVDSYKKSLPLTCILESIIFCHYSLNADIYKPLVSKPLNLDEEILIELGLCYKPGASREVRSFIQFAGEYCSLHFK